MAAPACVRASPVMSATSLIAAVYRRRSLWDPTDVHHHNRVVVAGLWKQIGLELGINMMLAKSKWRGLRDYYRQQLKRAMEQPESMVGSTWAHFEEMSFLGPSMSAAASRNVKKEDEEEEPEGGDGEAGWSPHWQVEPEDCTDPWEDDDLLFFRSLLPDLRGLPRAKKAWIRLQIQQVVFQEVYSGSKSPPARPDSSPSPTSPPPLVMPCKVEMNHGVN